MALKVHSVEKKTFFFRSFFDPFFRLSWRNKNVDKILIKLRRRLQIQFIGKNLVSEKKIR